MGGGSHGGVAPRVTRGAWGNERANVRRAGECAAAHDQHGRVVMAHGRACWLTWACKRMETE